MNNIKQCLMNPIKELETFNLVKKHITYKDTNININGISDSEVSHFIFSIFARNTKVIITATEKRAKEITEELKFFLGDNVYFYPAKDLIFYSADVHSNDITRSRMEIIREIYNNKEVTVVMSIEALVDPLIPFEELKNSFINLKMLDKLELTNLKKSLVYMGYERVSKVEARGQFAIRGGIVDIFGIDQDDIVRIELFGDEIDSIRMVNAETQRSINNIEEILILSAREIVVNDERVFNAIKEIKSDYKKATKIKDIDVLRQLKETYENLIDKVENFGSFNGIESNVYYYFDKIESILDYVKPTQVIMVEPLRIAERINGMSHEYNDSYKSRFEKGYLLSKQLKLNERFKSILDEINNYQVVMTETLLNNKKVLNYELNVSVNTRSINVYHQNFELMLEDIRYYLKNHYKIVLITVSKARAKRLKEIFLDNKIETYYLKDFCQELEESKLAIGYGNLYKGFAYPDIKFAMLAETDNTVKKKSRKKRRYKDGQKIESFTELKIGDYVVHENHGVGVFQGIETIESDNKRKDYIKVSYRDNGNLYIDINQLDNIQKYIGKEGKAPRLNKLGNKEWSKAKSKVKKAVDKIATELIELYAKRENSKGFVYSKDNEWQEEFEDMFPYDETEDQINAINDAKKDMESIKIMDRLVCGDVGYGKTEVAIRAAFKAVQDGKQVAYLVPTTILAQQHYNNFIQRMKDFPIEVRMLSRFVTKKAQQKTTDDLLRGTVDIVIGTHRVISKDVKFKDLGLLIIDEEQRFGVKHKEKIKEVKSDIDVLTLTATPIPRTLHMSMIGIRDMSLLEEPPQERIPIQTYVLEHNDELIKDALYREFSRGGQSYVVHNRVNDIDEVAGKISKLVPEATVAFAHGQMSERELERIMVDFINGEIDILVATTIIETGLDISNVNTIIIQNADHMGLSQLYQLRGRVGRSSRTSYAYLTYKKDKVLKEIAEKRLKAIKEFTEFGSGFRIAMRDLEIRGAGNILGESQSGHMDAVGYELYCKMLEDSIKKMKGEKIETIIETTINLPVNAYIPNNYIKDEIEKVASYKKIATIRNIEDYMDMQDELIDRYGEMPKSVINLLDVALLKSIANSIKITDISLKSQSINIYLLDEAPIDVAKIPEIVSNDKNYRSFTLAGKPHFSIKYKDKVKNSLIVYVKTFLEELEEIKIK